MGGEGVSADPERCSPPQDEHQWFATERLTQAYIWEALGREATWTQAEHMARLLWQHGHLTYWAGGIVLSEMTDRQWETLEVTAICRDLKARHGGADA